MVFHRPKAAEQHTPAAFACNLLYHTSTVLPCNLFCETRKEKVFAVRHHTRNLCAQRQPQVLLDVAQIARLGNYRHGIYSVVSKVNIEPVGDGLDLYKHLLRCWRQKVQTSLLGEVASKTIEPGQPLW